MKYPTTLQILLSSNTGKKGQQTSKNEKKHNLWFCSIFGQGVFFGKNDPGVPKSNWKYAFKVFSVQYLVGFFEKKLFKLKKMASKKKPPTSMTVDKNWCVAKRERWWHLTFCNTFLFRLYVPPCQLGHPSDWPTPGRGKICTMHFFAIVLQVIFGRNKSHRIKFVCSFHLLRRCNFPRCLLNVE